MIYKFRLIGLFFIVFFVSSCASPQYMQPTQTLYKPIKEKALVRFMLPTEHKFKNEHIWDGERFLGTGRSLAQFDYYADPGKHIFFIYAHNKAFLEAELEGGKTYYILVRHWVRWLHGRSAGFVPVNRGSEFWDKVKEYESTLNKYEIDFEATKEYEDKYKGWVKKHYMIYETTWKNEYDWPKLNPEDGR